MTLGPLEPEFVVHCKLYVATCFKLDVHLPSCPLSSPAKQVHNWLTSLQKAAALIELVSISLPGLCF
jgi:hypothetical protein